MPTLKLGEKSPAFILLDEKGRIAGAWYKISPKDTVPKALAALEGRA